MNSRFTKQMLGYIFVDHSQGNIFVVCFFTIYKLLKYAIYSATCLEYFPLSGGRETVLARVFSAFLLDATVNTECRSVTT